jgi:hypothetical protein
MVCGWQVPVWIRCAYDAGESRHTHGARTHGRCERGLRDVSRGEGGLGMKTAASYIFSVIKCCDLYQPNVDVNRMLTSLLALLS